MTLHIWVVQNYDFKSNSVKIQWSCALYWAVMLFIVKSIFDCFRYLLFVKQFLYLTPLRGKGYIGFVLLYVMLRNIWDGPIKIYTDRLVITFWVDLAMSVRLSVCLSVCLSMYSRYHATGRISQPILMKFGPDMYFVPETNCILFEPNRFRFGYSPHIPIQKNLT